jgi:Protein of unknown function (DUF2726)
MEAPETIFAGTLAEEWGPVLDIIQKHGAILSSDPVFRQAVDTFIKAFLSSQKGPSFSAPIDASISERILLFHAANRIRLQTPDLQMLVHRSLHYWQSDVSRSVGLAKLLPDDPVCQTILNESDLSQRAVGGIAVTERSTERSTETSTGKGTETPPGNLSRPALLPLFKSHQEKEFYHAVRSFYPQQLIGVNVSIHAVVNLDLVRAQLTNRERNYFYKALLDCVVYNIDDEYRPMIVFEIDSPLHDDQNQIERDALKDRILAVAGLRLVRIRPDQSRTNRRQFLALLRNAEIANNFSKNVTNDIAGNNAK